MVKKTCPLCNSVLTLNQVNFTLAVYICEDLNCKYPIGFDCIVVERKFKDMDKDIEMVDDNIENLDNWSDDIIDKPHCTSVNTTNKPNNDYLSTNSTLSSDIIDVKQIFNDSWIQNPEKGKDNPINCQQNQSSTVLVDEIPNNTSPVPYMGIDLDDMFDFVYNIQ